MNSPAKDNSGHSGEMPCPVFHSPPQHFINSGGPGAPSAETPVLSHRSCLHLQTRLHAGKIISLHPQGKADCQIFSFPILICAILKCLLYHQQSPTAMRPPQQIKPATAARKKSATRQGDMPQNELILLHFGLRGSEGTQKKKRKKSLNSFSFSFTHQKRNREMPAKAFPTLEQPLPGSETGCHTRHGTTAASSKLQHKNAAPWKRDTGEASPALCARCLAPSVPRVSWGLEETPLPCIAHLGDTATPR